MGYISLLIYSLSVYCFADLEPNYSQGIINALNKGKSYNVATPKFFGRQFGSELADLLLPHDLRVKKLFSEFIDTSAIAQTTKPPQTRAERTGFTDDLAHQRGLQIQINRGNILPNTLILSDSGHDIPIAAQLLKNQQFTTQVIFYLPIELSTSSGTSDRLLSQAQDWSEDIFYLQQNHALKGKPNIIFVGLEGHRKGYNGKYLYKIPWNRFPNKAQLRNLGIEQVIYMTEAHPDHPEDVLEKMRKDVSIYLKKLDLPLTLVGVDCRRREGC